MEQAAQSKGFFERTQGKMNPLVLEHYYKKRMGDIAGSSMYLLNVMRAHVCMLAKQDIIPRDMAKALSGALSGWTASGGITHDMLDPAFEDLYLNMEHMLKEKLGAETAGYLPVARSRNDVEAAMWRMEIREKLVVLARSVIRHASILIKRAGDNIDSAMPGYTYHQQAQPLTLGFQLAALSAAQIRDAERIVQSVKRLNLNPLGSAALAGTGYPIDREYTARLLGFDGVTDNCEDAVAACDYMLESASAALLTLTTLSRFAEEVIKWCQNEAGFAALPDDIIDSSSIMPQKRNPVVPATVRAQARLAAGDFAGMAAACTVAYEASRDVTIVYEKTIAFIENAYDMCMVSSAYAEGITFNLDKLRGALDLGFSTTTEIADTLVRDGNMPFRIAHALVGGLVGSLYDAGKGPENLTYEALRAFAREETGKDLPITKAQFDAANNVDENIARRGHTGGTSRDQVQKSLHNQQNRLSGLEKELTAFEAQWKEAGTLLDAACRGI
ncbi:MAG: argininosuccinate lyase [Oscillospiraceae bacterium]|jgi:argininosuccinate lyase|nr:argininosuccinate lyase [Oscillospiraceae bacterium]